MSALDIIKGVLPFIGTALGGPFGGAAATFLGSKLGIPDATVDSIKQVLSGMPPEKIVELKVAEQEFQLKMAALGYDSIEKLEELNVRAVEAVNKTMQAEAASDHWPTYSWRPYNGFLFGTTIFGCYIILPLLKIAPPVIPSEVWIAWGSMLGIASWFRGKAQADPTIQITNKG